MINLLKKLMNNENIDGYIVPKNDEFFSEYSFPNRLKLISNFSGSAGLAIILKDKNLLFVDGRYTLQANIECGKNFKIFEIPKIRPFDLITKIKNKLTLGFDPKLFTEFSLKSNFRDTCNLIPINNNLIDEIFNLKNNYKTREFYCLNEIVAGEKITSKLYKLSSILKKKKIENIFISAPENCAWLLNIRGFDNPNSPIPNCQIIFNNKNIYFFSDIKKIRKIKNTISYKKIKFYEFKEFAKVINNLKGKNFSIDKNSCSVFNKSIILSKFNILNEIDPFRDGGGAYRMGTYLHNLIKGFENGLKKDDVLLQGAEIYSKKWGKDILNKIMSGKIDYGMNESQVRVSIGNPNIINNTSSRHSVSEQWIYGNN